MARSTRTRKLRAIFYFVGLIIFGAIGGILGIPSWIIALLAAAFCFSYLFLLEPRVWPHRAPGSSRPRRPAESRYSVTCTDEEIAVSFDGNLRERCRWDEILVVGIRIDDSFLPSPWWIVGGSKGGCMFPFEASAWEGALNEMSQRLAGFNHEAVIKAAGMMSGGIVVWKKEESEGRDSGNSGVPRTPAGGPG